MGLAEINANGSHGVTDRLIVASQLGSRLEIHCRDIVTKGDPEGASVGRVRVIEVAAIVTAQHP